MTGRKNPPPPPPSSRTSLSSCIVATIFLTFITILLLITFFTLLKPRNPTIAVTAVQIPSFSAANATTVTFTISQYVAIRNPNGGVFIHRETSIRLLCGGGQVGSLSVPAGKIVGRGTKYLAATFEAEGFSVGDNGVQVGPSLEIEMKMEMAGRVGLLGLFSHHVEGKVDCKVEVAINGGSILGFHC